MKASPIRPARRAVLASLAAGAGAVAAVIAGRKVTSQPVASGSAPPEDREAASGGYRETAHVRNYYRTTKI